jgi:hypothetical protein
LKPLADREKAGYSDKGEIPPRADRQIPAWWQVKHPAIKEALQRLKDWLEILEDNRTKTQGCEDWHFTLKLWSKDNKKI